MISSSQPNHTPPLVQAPPAPPTSAKPPAPASAAPAPAHASSLSTLSSRGSTTISTVCRLIWDFFLAPILFVVCTPYMICKLGVTFVLSLPAAVFGSKRKTPPTTAGSSTSSPAPAAAPAGAPPKASPGASSGPQLGWTEPPAPKKTGKGSKETPYVAFPMPVSSDAASTSSIPTSFADIVQSNPEKFQPMLELFKILGTSSAVGLWRNSTKLRELEAQIKADAKTNPWAPFEVLYFLLSDQEKTNLVAQVQSKSGSRFLPGTNNPWAKFLKKQSSVLSAQSNLAKEYLPIFCAELGLDVAPIQELATADKWKKVVLAVVNARIAQFSINE